MTATQAPDTLRLVPAEPTIDMVDAGMAAPMSDERKAATDTLTRQIYTVRDIYRAMLSAAPAVQPAAGKEVEHELIERLLDAQQDINLAANETMRQSLADASQLIDEIEPILRAALAHPPAQGSESGGERDYPAEFEAWWATYKHRNRDVAEYPVKKQIAFDAFYFAALSAPQAAPGD